MRELKGTDTSVLREKREKFSDHRSHRLCITTIIILSSVTSAEVVYLLPRHSCPFKVFLNSLHQFMCAGGKRLTDIEKMHFLKQRL